MMHIAYPTVDTMVLKRPFWGCVRYRSLAQDPGNPYCLAIAHSPNRVAVLAAVHTLIPESLLREPSARVYEIADVPGPSAGTSLDFAYFLATIRCVRALRLEALQDAGDVWCTGAIAIHGENEPALGDVIDTGFLGKLQGFLNQNHDRLFFAPAANMGPEAYILCEANRVPVLQFTAFCARLDQACTTGSWPEPTVIAVGPGHLRQLVDVLFERGEEDLSTAEFELVLQKTWQISLDHLSSVLNPEEYDENANLIDVNRESTKRKFDEKLFVSPQEESILELFLASNKRGMIFVGKSGIGKSNLMCSSFLKQRRKREICIFIDARRMKSSNIRDFFKSSIRERMEDNFDIGEFDAYLETMRRTVIVFIDAVNEYSSIDGPLGLLKNIINFVEDANVFNSIKIIVSCRSETWHQYKEYVEKEKSILNDEVFLTADGDAFPVAGFEGEQEREALFCTYQKYYKLLPYSYESQSRTFKDLVKYPFMMGIIAETYSNTTNNLDNDNSESKQQIIPKILNFFALFRLLTERKALDANRLLRAQDSKSEVFEEVFHRCLSVFADLLYQRLSETSNVEDDSASVYKKRTDSLPAMLLHTDNDFKNFMEKFSDESRISVFDTLVQVGLIEKTYIVEQDYAGYDRQVTAYKFFHDQYTQYWLAAIYNTPKILGRISSNIRDIESVAYKIQNILDNSKHAPVLSGALDHWFYNNMSNGERSISDFLVTVFNYLAANEAGSAKFYVSSFLYSLIEKNIVEPKKLFKTIFEQGNFQLKKCLVDYIPELWPDDISSECFRAFIESCDDEKDDTILRGIGDIFADLFLLESQRVIEFMDGTLHGFDGKQRSLFKNIKNTVFDMNNFIKHIAFILKFSLKAVLTNFSDIEKMDILREFLRKKYRYIIDAALLSNDKRSYSIKSILRGLIYRKLEYNGLNQWDQTVASQGGNNTFFIEDNGLVQRDILYEYYKYVVDFHNGHIELLPLDKESHFRKITVQMMNYRDGSVIGYVATVLLSAVIKDNREILNDIIDELIACNSKSSRHFTSLLLIIIALMNKDQCHTILDIYINKFLPHIVSSRDYIGYSIILNVASIDIDRYWEYVRKILDYICETLTNTHDTEKISILEDDLPFCCFLPEIKIGTNIIHYMISKGFLDNPLWRACALKILAGLLARSPKTLHDLLIKEGIDTSIVNEVRPLINEAMFEMKDIKSYHYSWNEFVVAGIFSLIKLRFFLIKDLLAGLIQSNSVEEYSKEFRRFVIETARGFLNDDKNDTYYLSISLEQVLDETESKRISGGGKLWVPRAAAPALPGPHQQRSAEVGGRS